MARILVLEDDQTMRSLLKTLLELENHSVFMPDLDNLEMAILDHIVICNPSIIIMDLYIAGIDGLNLLKVIRVVSNFDNIRIIMSSGMDKAVECALNGADHFLLKPFMPHVLIQIING